MIKKPIDDGLANTSVTVACVGAKTAGRDYINYEIEQSIARGNGNVDAAGAIPAKITAGGYKAYKYVDHERLATWIEASAKAAGRYSWIENAGSRRGVVDIA